MAEIRLSTAGVTMNYAVEKTAGTRPTSGYAEVSEVTETPEMNVTPGQIDVTPLSAKEYKIYIPDLKDMGGVLSFTANFSQTELDLWNKTIVSAYETGIAEGKNTWFCIVIPDMEDAFYFTGIPSKIGLPAMSVGAALQVGLPITPSNEPDWYAKPTDIAS